MRDYTPCRTQDAKKNPADVHLSYLAAGLLVLSEGCGSCLLHSIGDALLDSDKEVDLNWSRDETNGDAIFV
jgi:hypothetical protein